MADRRKTHSHISRGTETGSKIAEDEQSTKAIFQTEWKTARLVLIRKENKPMDEPSSNRPLCMLNTSGKLFEKIIDSRIRNFLETNSCLAPKLYGFLKERSTIDAVTRLREIVDEFSGNIRNMVRLFTLDIRKPLIRHAGPELWKQS